MADATAHFDPAVMSAEAPGAAPAAEPPLLATTDVEDIVEAVQMLQVRCTQLSICACFSGAACATDPARPLSVASLSAQLHCCFGTC